MGIIPALSAGASDCQIKRSVDSASLSLVVIVCSLLLSELSVCCSTVDASASEGPIIFGASASSELVGSWIWTPLLVSIVLKVLEISCWIVLKIRLVLSDPGVDGIKRLLESLFSVFVFRRVTTLVLSGWVS